MNGVSVFIFNCVLILFFFASSAHTDFQKEIVLTKDNFHEELSHGENMQKTCIHVRLMFPSQLFSTEE